MQEDYELLSMLKQRDPDALEAAIHRYAGYVAAVVKKTLGGLATAEDVEELTSDAFVALWEHAEKLREDSSLKYWLAVVARNGTLKRLGRTRLEEPLEDNLLFAEESPPQDEAERRDEARQVREAVESLDEEDQDIFLRHYFWYQSVSQIARETGKNDSTIKSRLKRGREKLRKKLVKEDWAV